MSDGRFLLDIEYRKCVRCSCFHFSAKKSSLEKVVDTGLEPVTSVTSRQRSSH